MTRGVNAAEAVSLPRSPPSYLLSALESTDRADQRAARASPCPGAAAVAVVVRPAPVQDPGEEADVVTDLRAVSKLQQG